MTRQGISDRWSKHKSKRNTGRLKEAILEYGPESFSIQVLEKHECLIDAMISELTYIKELNSMYPNGYNNLYTKDASDKMRFKQKNRSKSDETKLAISIGLTGLKQSKETVQKRIDRFYKPITDQHGSMYNSISEASKALGIPIPSICHVLSGKTLSPRHGYKFQFVRN